MKVGPGEGKRVHPTPGPGRGGGFPGASPAPVRPRPDQALLASGGTVSGRGAAPVAVAGSGCGAIEAPSV